MNDEPDYLQPYANAARQFGGGFRSLLWASTHTQAARFDAMNRLCPFAGRTVLDVGAGRGDLLTFLRDRGNAPAHYVGLEAVPELADVCQRTALPDGMVIRGDFIKDPVRLFAGAEIVAFSGSLNTLPPADFYRTLKYAWDATAWRVVFNFLSSPNLAAATHLHWHQARDVLAYVQQFDLNARWLDDYLDGDTTIVISKPDH